MQAVASLQLLPPCSLLTQTHKHTPTHTTPTFVHAPDQHVAVHGPTGQVGVSWAPGQPSDVHGVTLEPPRHRPPVFNVGEPHAVLGARWGRELLEDEDAAVAAAGCEQRAAVAEAHGEHVAGVLLEQREGLGDGGVGLCCWVQHGQQVPDGDLGLCAAGGEAPAVWGDVQALDAARVCRVVCVKRWKRRVWQQGSNKSGGCWNTPSPPHTWRKLLTTTTLGGPQQAKTTHFHA